MGHERLRPPTPVGHGGFVYRFVAPNPGPMTLGGTNCYIAGFRSVYIIDPGPADRRHLDSMVHWLQSGRRVPLGILLTHSHGDHAGGADSLAKALKTRIVPVDAGEVLHIDGDSLRGIPTPGHSPDGMSFLLETRAVLFSGDTILGTGSTAVVPPDGDMTAYVESLKRLRSLSPSLLAPGHGPVVKDPVRKIQEYIDHRLAREQELLDALSLGSWTASELTDRLYRDTAPALRQWATGSITAGLTKLERDGVVHRVGDSWSRRDPGSR